jgi:hypothetical protein
MIEQYLEIDMKKLGLFVGLTLGSVVIVTLVFGLIFGFDRWQQNIQTSSQLMAAASQTPVGAAPNTHQPVAGQFVCPAHGAIGLPQFDAAGVPHCPLDGQVMSMVRNQRSNMALVAAPG